MKIFLQIPIAISPDRNVALKCNHLQTRIRNLGHGSAQRMDLYETEIRRREKSNFNHVLRW